MNRIITGLIVGAVWLLLLFRGNFVLFWLTIIVLAALALHEYCSMMVPSKGKQFSIVGIAAGLLPPIAAYTGQPSAVAAGLFMSLLVLLAFTLYRYGSLEQPIDFLIRLIFGAAYVGVCSAHLTLIMARQQGALWLLVLTAITVASDTGAYYCGSFFGKTKLCPAISPGKTVEGFIGGLFCGVAAALAVAFYFFPGFNVLKMTVIAIILACFGVMGDLTESVIKRSAGVKDSGTLLPGHGGVLDRIDSVLITAPILFYLLHFNFFSGA